jgi:malyl-CoA/(S)-citramalyl-CoA lyase
MHTRTPTKHFSPLAIGAPEPYRTLPVRLERMIHFVPPQNDKLRGRVKEMMTQVDVVLGNLEDAIPADQKDAARAGFVKMAQENSFGKTGQEARLWSRINCLNSPWGLDDILTIVPAAGAKLDVIMLPKVEGPWDIHYLDQLLAQLEAKHNIAKPILIHAILETAEGVKNVDAIAAASPRVGGGHPSCGGRADGKGDAPRTLFQQDLWHYTVAKMVDACQSYGIKAFYGPFGDFSDLPACEAQFRNAFLMGCVGAWSLHPTQIDIAKNVFSPDPVEVAFAKKIIAAMPDGTGAVMIDGKMQDDATWKQAKVIVDLAKLVASKDPARAATYGF